jgi:hypothetical protein
MVVIGKALDQAFLARRLYDAAVKSKIDRSIDRMFSGRWTCYASVTRKVDCGGGSATSR